MLDNKTSSTLNTENIEITQEFEEAFDLLINKRQNVFIEGKAGSGKSTFISLLKQKIEGVVVVAPTGVAAMNIGGQTIHSFFTLKPGIVDLGKVKKKNIKLRQIYKKISILVIDEISMVRADLFEAIDKFLKINCENSRVPFGGIPVCVIGDMLQLEPIVSSHEAEMFYKNYESPFFNNTESYRQANFSQIVFSKIFRQKDTKFVNLLNYIRKKVHHPKILQSINTRVRDIPKNESIAVLTPSRLQAKKINEEEFEKIDSEVFTYNADIVGNFNADLSPAPSVLKLKVGACVMFLRNDIVKNSDSASPKRWVNGTIGIVESLDNFNINVRVGNRVFKVEPEKWEKIIYSNNPETKEVEEKIEGTFTQYPLILAWAITIHKSQGKTLEKVLIDLGRGTFASGQLYVALSRCKSFEGLYLKRPVSYDDIF